MDYVRKIDPKAFVTVYSVSDMRYQPKKQPKRYLGVWKRPAVQYCWPYLLHFEKGGKFCDSML